MKFRHTVQLGAALILLVLLYFGLQVMNRQSAQEVVNASKIFQFNADDIRKLNIEQLDRVPTVAIRKDDGDWAITAPNPNIRPYEPLWTRVSEHLADLKNERFLPDDALDLEAYGLSVPRLTVSVDAGGESHTLKFGYLDPTQTNRYAQLDGGTVFLVDKAEVFELDRPLDLLRDSYVMDDPEAPVLRFEFARFMTAELAATQADPPPVGEVSSSVVLQRDSADSPWYQLEPVQVAANQELVNEFVDEIQTARGRDHIDAPESYADYGLDPAMARITVVDGADGIPQAFYFGDTTSDGEKGGVYVRKDGEAPVFLMDGHILTLFPRSMNAFRERRLLGTLKSPTRVVRTGTVGQDYTLALDAEGRWQMIDPPLDDTDPFYVSQFISALKSLEGTRFYPGGPADYGLDTPEIILSFTLEGRDDPIEARLTPAPDVEGQYYVLTDTGEVASIPQEHIQFLLNDAQAFRDRNLLRFDSQRATRMAFSFEGTDYVLEKEHGRWLITSPENYFVSNQKDAENMLAAITDLRAVGTEHEDGAAAVEYGLETPRFTFSVTLAPVESGGAPQVLGPLTVGNIVPGIDQQRFASSAERDGIFLIQQRFVEAVQAAIKGIRPQPGTTEEGN